MSHDNPSRHSTRSVLTAVALGAVAGALGWGIRGQFGGQTGATVPGALFGLCVAMALGYRGWRAMTLGAVGALAFSMGGTMTYGQTLGLMHNVPNSPTYWWGFLGVAIKGGVWIALGGVILGMVAGAASYSMKRLTLILAGGVVFFLLGTWVLNSPFDPPDRLPSIYFSDPIDKPRHECWGGLLLGWLWMIAVAAGVRDRLAVRLSLFGLVGGAAGFAGGQMIQAWAIHAVPLGDVVQPWIDWWKVMECFFGGCAGAALALGAATARGGPRPPERQGAAPSGGGRWTLGSGTWAGGVTLLWACAWLAGDLGLLPLSVVLEMPFAGIAIPLLCCFAEQAAAGKGERACADLVCVGVVLLLSVSDVAGKLVEARLYWPIAPMLVAAFAGWAGFHWARRRSKSPRAAGVITFVAITQTALTWIKQSIDADGGALRAYPQGAALTVEVVFVVLAALAVAIVYAYPVKPSTSEEPSP